MMYSLQSDGLVCKRANSASIEDLFVYGERSSGTNVTKKIMRSVYGVPPTKAYGWKHGAPSFMSASVSTLFMVSLRDAFDWCVSMYAKPYHAAEHMREYDFDEFIRAPWAGVMDAPKAHGLKRDRHLNQVLQPDRHIIEGRPYKNIFEMRSLKNRCWLGLLDRGVNVAIVRHEVFNSDPQKYADLVASHFDIPEERPFKKPGYIFSLREKTEKRRSHAKERLQHNLEFISSQLDPELESLIGYDIKRI